MTAESISVSLSVSGRAVLHRCRDARITFDENNVHNEISISFNDPDLFSVCNPALGHGSARIRAIVGARSISFLLETRDGEETDFSIWGRSLAALEDAPFATDIDFQLDEPTQASILAASFLENVSLSWQVTDWVVPTDFEFSGKPLDGVIRLAEEIGAIVRTQDNGNLLVRNKFPTVPSRMNSASAAVNYDRDFILALTHSTEQESGYNAVTILGKTHDVQAPKLELEETDPSPPLPGQEVFVKAYWPGKEENISKMFVTDGSIESFGFYTETVEEDVSFVAGAAGVRYPIYSLSGVSWYGKQAGETVEYTQHGTELRVLLDDPTVETKVADVYGLAKVSYTARYQRFRLYEHDVYKLMAVLFLITTPEVYADIRTASPAVYGNPIDAPLLTTEDAAVSRGKAWIAKNKHRFSVLRITAPHNDNAVDGNLAYINDSAIGECGNHHIESVTISIEGPKITNELTVKKCLTSFQ